MNERVPTSPETLPLSIQREINERCKPFVAAWQAGQRPRIEHYLGDTREPMRSELLAELLREELDYRRNRKGEVPTQEEYARFVGQEAVMKKVFALPDMPGYKLLKEIGRGAMGVVYAAEQVALKRKVALKMVRSGEMASAAEIERFKTDAHALAALNHPNIVTIHDIGEHNGLPYFSLEYVDGGNLAAKLRDWPPSDTEAARVVELLARTVHYAHGLGIIHRDLKPANVLLTSDGVLKIADFGLAKFLAEDRGATRTGEILGTASYMAPEQASGKTSEIGPASDVYALGAILYELLTGRPPFRGETFLETLRHVTEEAPDPPRVHNPRVDRALEAICLKCLKKTAADRYLSAEALAEDLARFRVGERIRAHDGSAWDWIRPIVQESPHAEFMTLWSRGLMANAVLFFVTCVAWYLLLANGVEQYAPYYALVAAKLVTDYVLISWWFRIKDGPPLRHFEYQILRVQHFCWILFFLTIWQYQSTGGPVSGLLPILVLEVAFAYGCAAIILGGSFYPTATAFAGAVILQALRPDVGPLILASAAPAIFWAGWKYSRRPPVR